MDPKVPFGISRVPLPLPGEGVPTPASLGQDQEGLFTAHLALGRQEQSQMWGAA